MSHHTAIAATLLGLAAWSCAAPGRVSSNDSPPDLEPLGLLADRPPAGPIRVGSFQTDAIPGLPFAVDPAELTIDQVEPERFLVMRFDDGFVVGTNCGEWGGGVWWFARDGSRRQFLVEDNCVALATDGEVLLAVTGLGHLGLGKGAVHAFTRRRRGWRHHGSVPLPGAPTAVRQSEEDPAVLRFGVFPPTSGRSGRRDAPLLGFPFSISAEWRAGEIRYWLQADG